MKKTLSLILSLLLLFTVACADTVYDLGGDFRIALPDNTTTYSNWYYVDNVMFFFNVNDLADFGYQQQWLDSLKDSALETLAVIIFGTNDGYQTEEIVAGIPCASFRYTEQGYEYRFVLALNGTKLLTAAMTDSTTGKYPDEAACRSIMNALFVYAQEDTQINVQVKNYLTDHGFYLQNGPLLVDLSENEYNIVYQDMPYDSLSVQRSGYAYNLIDSALKMGEGTDMMIWRLNENGLTGENAMAYIRAKEKKYDASEDFRSYSPADLKAVADAFAEVMSATGTYDIKEINGIPYIVFPFAGDNQLRGMTVINGGYVYIYVKKTDPLTTADEAFLYTVLEHITVAD